MNQYKNTKADFWDSLDAGKSAIVCPCCGTRMTLQFSASYQLMLTREASQHLNHQLSLYRQTIRAVEQALGRYNSPEFKDSSKGSIYSFDENIVSYEGKFVTTTSVSAGGLLCSLDLEKIDRAITKLPKLNESSKNSGVPSANLSRLLLQLIQPPLLSAGLNTAVFDQPGVKEVLSKSKPMNVLSVIRKIRTGKLDNGNPLSIYLFKEFPYLLSYCDLAVTDFEDECLIRVLAILIVYFGHGDKEAGDKTEIPEFTFGNYAQLRNLSSLAELLSSYYYVLALQETFTEFHDYVYNKEHVQDSAKVEERNVEGYLKLGSPDNVEKFREWVAEIPQFKGVVLYTVDFACSGPAAAIPKDATIAFRQKNKKVELKISEHIRGMVESEVCGWIPKDQPTESLLLVGGTASSKTTLLQSTVVQVKRAAANLGMVFETSSPLSNLLMQYYEQRYDGAQWSGATESGDRTSLQISLRQANNPDNVFNLVVNDIAGEHFEEMLMVEKDYSVIQSPLTYAQHIIFLFDLVAWRQLGAFIEDTVDKGNWKAVVEERRRQETVGRAVTDSRDLMVKLVNRVKRASAKGQKIDRSFILAIPKCDYYIQEGMFLNKWVADLTTDKYFRKHETEGGIYYTSTWNFGSDENLFSKALEGIGKMSRKASDAIRALSKPNMNEAGNIVAGERVATSVSSILDYLESTFLDVKVVPVSALGKIPDKNDNVEGEFSTKAIPLFCEALLLLPMIKMQANVPTSVELEQVVGHNPRANATVTEQPIKKTNVSETFLGRKGW